MAVESQARDISNDRLQRRLALNEWQAGGVTAIKMQKVEGIKDQARTPLPVRSGLGFSEAWKAVGPDAAQFTVEIGCLRPAIRH